MAMTLPTATLQRLQASVKRYLVENLDPDAGDLKARLLLDFCIQEVGAVVYNQAIADAQKLMQAHVQELDSVCYQDEFSYFPRSR
jgi:uncharacterized protein (DUF2164 family)